MGGKDQNLSVVILAAGKGTRMRSGKAKVLHPLAGRPMLAHVLDLADGLGAAKVVAVVGHQAETVRQAFAGRAGLAFALQEPQRGTGHAVMAAAPELAGRAGDVLVLMGDVPGLRLATARALLAEHRARGNAMTVLAMDLAEPGHYGRLITGPGGELKAIVEYRDASEAQRAVSLVNAGIYVFGCEALLAGLPGLSDNNDQGEYYLTDMVEVMRRQGRKVGYQVCSEPAEAAGINSPEELAAAEARLAQGAGA